MNDEQSMTVSLNNNFGFAAGYGVSNKCTMKTRFEHLYMTPDFRTIFGGDDGENDDNWNDLEKMNFFEFNNRIRLKANAPAISAPVGFNFNTVRKKFRSGPDCIFRFRIKSVGLLFFS